MTNAEKSPLKKRCQYAGLRIATFPNGTKDIAQTSGCYIRKGNALRAAKGLAFPGPVCTFDIKEIPIGI